MTEAGAGLIPGRAAYDSVPRGTGHVPHSADTCVGGVSVADEGAAAPGGVVGEDPGGEVGGDSARSAVARRQLTMPWLAAATASAATIRPPAVTSEDGSGDN
jgi:hypothetical protein